jgi:hypothetical protein
MSQEYFISIGEPWNFEGPDGRGKICGVILKEINEKVIIFESHKNQTFKEGQGNLFILIARYKDDAIRKVNNKGEHVYSGTVGGRLLQLKNYRDKTREYLEEHSKYVFIGTIKDRMCEC